MGNKATLVILSLSKARLLYILWLTQKFEKFCNFFKYNKIIKTCWIKIWWKDYIIDLHLYNKFYFYSVSLNVKQFTEV